MAKTSKKPTKKVEGFLIRSLRGALTGGKKTVVKHGVSSVIALIISSIMPVLQSWHAEARHTAEVTAIKKEAADSIAATEARCNQAIKDQQMRTDDEIKVLWETLHQQQTDKNETNASANRNLAQTK